MPAVDIPGLYRALDRQRRANAMLKARLAALEADLSDCPPAWGDELTVNELALMAALVEAHPKAMNKVDLEQAMPRRDHAADRDLKVVDVIIRKVRAKLGRPVIENVWGIGWRCSDAFKRSTEL